MAFLEVFSLRTKSTTYDEGTHLAYGSRGLEQGTFDRDRNSFDATMPVSLLNALAADLLSGEEEASRRQKIFRARLATVALSLVLALLVFAWACELYGPRAGLVAAFLCVFSPNVLAHGRLVTTDLALALGFFSATYAFWRYLRAPSWSRLAVAGLAFGLAQLAKITAAFLIFIFLLILSWRAWQRSRRGREDAPAGGLQWRLLSRELMALGVLCASAVLVVNAGFGFEGTLTPLADYSFKSERLQHLQQIPLLAAIPLPAPVPFVQGVDLVSLDMARDRWTYCLGKYHTQGVWYYYLVAFALKVPIPMLLMLGLALSVRGRGSDEGSADGAGVFLLVPCVFLWVYLSGFYQYQIGLRHLLPVFPFLFVFVSRLASLRSRRWPRAWPWAGGLLLAAYAWSSLAIYPHFLAYFNGLVGGPEKGWHYLIDSNLDWGQDRAQARHVYAAQSPVPVTIEPRAPMAGRLLVGVNRLVGLKPKGASKYAWLRENFEPVDQVGYSWMVYDVSLEALQECCPEVFRPLPDSSGNLAPSGRPIGRSRGQEIELLDRLNDESLGTGAPMYAAISAASTTGPVGGWFGIDWREKQLINRVRAYPALFLEGRDRQRFLASDLVAESWDGSGWVEIPGTRVLGNTSGRIDLSFSPIETKRVRLRVLRGRNHKGRLGKAGTFRIACLELAVFGPSGTEREDG